MSVTGISGFSYSQAEPASLTRRQQEDVAARQLQTTLQAGDLAGAQTAFNTLAAFGPNNSGPFSNPAMAADFQALGQAIQSGDLAGAQKDFTSLGNDQLKYDVSVLQQAVQSGNQGAAAQALAHLRLDFRAVYGPAVDGSNSAANSVTASSGSTGSVNLQA